MNINQVSNTANQITNTSSTAMEFDLSRQQLFESQLSQADQEMELKPSRDMQSEKERIDQQESEKNRERKIKSQDVTQDNLALTMLQQGLLKNSQNESLALEDLQQGDHLNKIDVEENLQLAQQTKFVQKGRAYTELVKERVNTEKTDLANPGLQEEEGTQQAKNSFADLVNRKDEKSMKNYDLDQKPFSQQDASQNQWGRKNHQLSLSQLMRESNTQKAQAANMAEVKSGDSLAKTPSLQQQMSGTTPKSSFEALLGSKAKNNLATNQNQNSVGNTENIIKDASKGEFTSKTTAANAPTAEEIEMPKVLGKVKIMLSAEKNEMVMSLSPLHLGKLELTLRKNEETGKLVAELRVESKEAKEALESQLTELQKGMEEQGLEIEDFSILVNDEGEQPTAFSFADGKNQQDFSQSGTSYASTNQIDREQSTERAPISSATHRQAAGGLNIIA
ncbi:MAG: hypothetical protein COB67_03515 [SAR324 cluster bacterium]|uniref:Flagellar hook-length control protein-like C-terminal domain-containing protein n=1 Tax=SAR324 cluster bacterium TaxID=2024889 RepID=A0A2A4T983_9DELT|nr:MAG: hypothetical protein COB67_03515 [SAR324 cluster bacterium]